MSRSSYSSWNRSPPLPAAAPRPVAPSGRLLPRLLPAERGQVEVGVGATGLLQTAGECGVGVEHLVPDPQERAQPGVVAAPLGDQGIPAAASSSSVRKLSSTGATRSSTVAWKS